jgi:hypothetical protein
VERSHGTTRRIVGRRLSEPAPGVTPRHLPRVCALEAVLANGSGAGTTSTGSGPVRWSARFVSLRGPDAGFYRRTPPAADAPAGSALGLEPVDTETVVSTVAVDADARFVDDVAREAIDAGSATVHEDRAVRAAGRVYAADGTYHLVYESTRRTPLVSTPPPPEPSRRRRRSRAWWRCCGRLAVGRVRT